MSNTNPNFDRVDLADTDAPTFTLDARDRNAIGALKGYRQRVNGDGVASAAYVAQVDQVIGLFESWTAANPALVMSPDQPYRSANDIDPAQANVVAGRANPNVAEDGEPDALNPPGDVPPSDHADPGHIESYPGSGAGYDTSTGYDETQSYQPDSSDSTPATPAWQQPVNPPPGNSGT